MYGAAADMLTQIPAGWVANKFGGKDILTVNMAGNALLLCALPAAARMGMGVLCAALSVMGAFQGPLIPAQGAIKAAWLKGLGADRPFVLRVMGLGSKIASTLTGLAVPALATSRWGWRLVPYVYGITTAGMAVAWHCLASNAPRSRSNATAVQAESGSSPEAKVGDADVRAADASRPAEAQPGSNAAEWGIMSLLPVQATMWAVSPSTVNL
jgi:MFS family permease